MSKKKKKFSKPANLVAKHAHKYNKATVHADRKNDYKRHNKFKKDLDGD